MFRNGKLIKRSIELITLRFELYASDIRLVKLLHIYIEA